MRERRELDVAAISFQRERDESGDLEVQGSERERDRGRVF